MTMKASVRLHENAQRTSQCYATRTLHPIKRIRHIPMAQSAAIGIQAAELLHIQCHGIMLATCSGIEAAARNSVGYSLVSVLLQFILLAIAHPDLVFHVCRPPTSRRLSPSSVSDLVVSKSEAEIIKQPGLFFLNVAPVWDRTTAFSTSVHDICRLRFPPFCCSCFITWSIII